MALHLGNGARALPDTQHLHRRGVLLTLGWVFGVLSAYLVLANADSVASWWFGLFLTVYVVSLGLPAARREYRRCGSWWIHAGWIVSALLAFLFVYGATIPQLLVLPGTLIVVVAYFLHGTGFREASPSRPRLLAAWLALGYVVLAVVNVFVDVRREGSGMYDVTTLARTSSDGLFVIAAWGYGLSALSVHDIPAYFRGCPCYPGWLRWVGCKLDEHRRRLAAWLVPLIVLAWVVLTAPAYVVQGLLWPTATSDDTDLLSVWVLFLLLYVVVLIPTAGLGFALGWRRPEGNEMTTTDRRALLMVMRPTVLLLSFALAMLAATTYLVAHEARWPLDNLSAVVGKWTPSGDVVAENAKVAAARLAAERATLEARARASSVVAQPMDGVLSEPIIAAQSVTDLAFENWRTWEMSSTGSSNRREADDVSRQAATAWIDAARVARLRQAQLAPDMAQAAAQLGEAASATVAAFQAWTAYADETSLRDSAAARSQFVGLVVFVFCAIVLQFVLLVELPYYFGQRRWREVQIARAEERLQAAEEQLRPVGPASSTTATAEAAAWTEYRAAQEQVRTSEDIPLHTFKNEADVARKLVQTAIGAILAAALGPSGKELAKAVLGN